jgi:hypothetical protein
VIVAGFDTVVVPGEVFATTAIRQLINPGHQRIRFRECQERCGVAGPFLLSRGVMPRGVGRELAGLRVCGFAGAGGMKNGAALPREWDDTASGS